MDNFLKQKITPNRVTKLLESILNSRAGQIAQTPLNIAKSRIAQPIIESTGQVKQKQYIPAVVNAASAAFNATPVGNAKNIGETVISGLLKSIREKTPIAQNITNISQSPTSSIGSQGLGISGPAAMGVDLLTANPRSLMNIKSAISPFVARNSYTNPKSFEMLTKRSTIDQPDLDTVDAAIDILRKPKKYKDSLKDAVNSIDLLADRYVPTNVIDKFKGNSLKIANWIVKNRKVPTNRNAAGEYTPGMNIGDFLPNILQNRKNG